MRCCISFGFIGNFIESQTNCTCSKTSLLSPGSVTMWLLSIGVENYCESSSIFTALYDLFVGLGIDKSLVWIRFSIEALLTPVVTCGFVFTERGGKKMLY